jgi:hypothetical protein
MPRKPLGERPMTPAERSAARRARQEAERQEMATEIERLRRGIANVAFHTTDPWAREQLLMRLNRAPQTTV